MSEETETLTAGQALKLGAQHLRDFGDQIDSVAHELEALQSGHEAEIREMAAGHLDEKGRLQDRIRVLEAHADSDVWSWQDDGANHIESMGDAMRISITALQFRKAIDVEISKAGRYSADREREVLLPQLHAKQEALTAERISSRHWAEEAEEAGPRAVYDLIARLRALAVQTPVAPPDWPDLTAGVFFRDGWREAMIALDKILAEVTGGN